MDFDILNTIYEEAGKIISFAVAGAGGYYLPKLSKKIKEKIQQKYFNLSLKKSVEIKVKLAEVKASLGATRIYLFQFHNGTVYLGDRSFHKYSMSAIFEVVNHGLSREIQKFQSVPLSKYAELIDFLIENEEDYVVVGKHKDSDMNYDEADIDDMLYGFGNTKGSMIFIEVHNEKKQFIGMIALTFDSDIPKSRFNDLRGKSELNQLLIEIRSII